MAKKDKKNTKETQAQPKKKKSFKRRFFAVAIFVAALSFMPTTFLVLIGILPSFVAFYVDEDKRKRGAFTIMCLNLAAVIGFVVVLWDRGHSIANSIALLMEPLTLMIIYFAAFIGWLLTKFIPPVISEYTKISARRRIRVIEKEQKELVKNWGAEVRGSFDPSSEADIFGKEDPLAEAD